MSKRIRTNPGGHQSLTRQVRGALVFFSEKQPQEQKQQLAAMPAAVPCCKLQQYNSRYNLMRYPNTRSRYDEPKSLRDGKPTVQFMAKCLFLSVFNLSLLPVSCLSPTMFPLIGFSVNQNEQLAAQLAQYTFWLHRRLQNAFRSSS